MTSVPWPEVPREAATAYAVHRAVLVAAVDRALFEHPERERLLGPASPEMVRLNHRNHHRFIANVLRFNDAELLANVLPWVYRSYTAHGLAEDYFPTVIEAFMAALDAHLEAEHAAAVRPVYTWMRGQHERLLALLSSPAPAPAVDPQWQPLVEQLLDRLLASDLSGCRRIAVEVVRREGDLRDLFQNVIQPAMVEVGRRWERGEITVAEEHLATAMVGRLLAQIYERVPVPDRRRGRVVVTAAPNEYHDLGARMVADLLERDGWDADYLGANTPTSELVHLLARDPPQALLISVCLPFNLDGVASLVETVRSTPGLSQLRILAGGQAFALSSDLWRRVGADAYAEDASRAVRQLEAWFPEAPPDPEARPATSSATGAAASRAEVRSASRPASRTAAGAAKEVSSGDPPDALHSLAKIQNELQSSQRALQKKIKELEDARENLRVLGGILPICGHCKKIRDDEGYWSQLEEYIANHSEADFSHSICPDCAREHYGAYLDDEP